MEELIKDIKEFLSKENLWIDTAIYYKGKKIYMADQNIHEKPTDVTKYIEYSNPNQIVMSFEGQLYQALHYNTAPECVNRFDAIFEKHDTYYEMGNAWNLMVYPQTKRG